MANQEHVEHLLMGVEHWNRWVLEPGAPRSHGVDLSGADLRGANLVGANLLTANLVGADLSGVDLTRADLRSANLLNANLQNACLLDSNLTGSGHPDSNLTLAGANFYLANLRGTDFRGANLRNADLIEANLFEAQLTSADFKGARLGYGSIASDWRQALNVTQIHHTGPSVGALDASALSMGELPDTLLRGCGLQDWEIWMAKLHGPDLTSGDITTIMNEVVQLRGIAPIQPRGVFISYSRKDSEFVDRLADQLRANHIRFWRDTDHMIAGPMAPQIDRAIVLHRTVLLVLSENAIESDWVALEVSKARELEKKGGVDYALCPITLDMAWKESDWPTQLRYWFENKYNILSFGGEDDFDVSFEKLLKGLEIYYPGKAD